MGVNGRLRLSDGSVYVVFVGDRYQIPLALFGVISSLGLWEGFRFCCDRWGVESHAIVRQISLRLIQFGELQIDCSSLSSLHAFKFYVVAVVG